MPSFRYSAYNNGVADATDWDLVADNNKVVATSTNYFIGLAAAKLDAAKAKEASAKAGTDPQSKTAANKPYYEVYERKDEQYGFRLIAGDKTSNLARSEGYPTAIGAAKGAESAISNFAGAKP